MMIDSCIDVARTFQASPPICRPSWQTAMSGEQDTSPPADRLASISTMWTVLRAAHEGRPSEAAQAQSVLLRRYGGAVYRYLLSAVRDPGTAEDLTQEFSLRLVQGNFRNVSPERGRFRSYVKTVLFHMVSEHRKRSNRFGGVPLPEDADLAAPADDVHADDEEFLTSWRDDLLARVWAALLAANPKSYALLKYKAEHPEATAEELAAQLSDSDAKATSAATARQILRRARDRFADLLVEEVTHSLDDPNEESVEEELLELGLMPYCRRVKRRDASSP
jgi:RNA polymerase sigma-70 factor (ECF subfamily)